jgi:4'-phosphopantetheinyl transferase
LADALFDPFNSIVSRGDAVELAIDPELGDNPARWQFWQMQPTSEHLPALSAERIDAQLPS